MFGSATQFGLTQALGSMSNIQASDVSQLSPAALRFAQAQRFLHLFNEASKPNGDCWFDMAMHFDAFLFCLVSVEEMIPDASKSQLQAIESFKFFKALRNITTHHSIVAGAHPAAKFPRALVRTIPLSVGAIETEPVEFKLKPDILRFIFDEVLRERPGETRTIDAARSYLTKLEGSHGKIYIRHVMAAVLADVQPHAA